MNIAIFNINLIRKFTSQTLLIIFIFSFVTSLFLLITTLNISIQEKNKYINIFDENIKNTNSINLNKNISIVLKPYQNVTKFPQYDDYTAKAIAILDIDKNEIIYQKNPTERLLIASLTKLITAKIIHLNYNLENTVILNDRAIVFNGSPLNLEKGQKFTIRDALKAILISSNNQLLYAIDDQQKIVEKANKYIKALKLYDTNITNPAGFDDLLNYSSAQDMLVISKAFFQTPLLADITAMEKAEITDLQTNTKILIHNTNELKKLNIDQVIAGKTGTTPNSGQSLILLVNNNKSRYIIVIIGAKNRYEDALKIINRL